MKALLSLILTLTLTLSCNAQKPEKASSEKNQCKAITQKGARCKLEKVAGTSYCKVHYAYDPKAAKCKATTKKGSQCSRAAVKGGYCTQHYNQHHKTKKS